MLIQLVLAMLDHPVFMDDACPVLWSVKIFYSVIIPKGKHFFLQNTMYLVLGAGGVYIS